MIRVNTNKDFVAVEQVEGSVDDILVELAGIVASVLHTAIDDSCLNDKAKQAGITAEDLQYDGVEFVMSMAIKALGEYNDNEAATVYDPNAVNEIDKATEVLFKWAGKIVEGPLTEFEDALMKKEAFQHDVPIALIYKLASEMKYQ